MVFPSPFLILEGSQIQNIKFNLVSLLSFGHNRTDPQINSQRDYSRVHKTFTDSSLRGEKQARGLTLYQEGICTDTCWPQCVSVGIINYILRGSHAQLPNTEVTPFFVLFVNLLFHFGNFFCLIGIFLVFFLICIFVGFVFCFISFCFAREKECKVGWVGRWEHLGGVGGGKGT